MASRTDLSNALQNRIREVLGLLRRDADVGFSEAMELLQGCANEVSAFLTGEGRTPVEVFLELGHVVDAGQEYRLVVRAVDIGFNDYLLRAYVPAQGFPTELDYMTEEKVECRSPEELVSQLVSFISHAGVRARLSAISQVLGDKTVRGDRKEVVRFDLPKAATSPSAAHQSAASRPAAAATATRQDDITVRLTTYIRDNPGKRIEQIAEALDESTRDLSPVIRNLISAKSVTKKGEKRGTRYYARGR